MTNKELVSELGTRLGVSQKNAGEMLKTFMEVLTDNIVGGNQTHFLNVGIIEQHYKEQRISVNPTTKKRMLVPPKMAVDFKAYNAFKNYIKTLAL